MATLEKKSPASSNKLPHQQSLPTPQVSHHQLHQQLSQPMVQNKIAESMQVSNEQQSDNSSLYSVELEPLNDAEHRYIDSDPGFGSMSSSEQAQISNRQNQMAAEQQEAHQKEVEDFKQEITKLKCDKLDLLRQNVVSGIGWAYRDASLTWFPSTDMSTWYQATARAGTFTSRRPVGGQQRDSSPSRAAPRVHSFRGWQRHHRHQHHHDDVVNSFFLSFQHET